MKSDIWCCRRVIRNTFPHGPSQSINTRVIMLTHTLFYGPRNQGQVKYYPIGPLILSDKYWDLVKCNEGHNYIQGCKFLLQWWILSHLAKGHENQELHTLDDKNTLKDLKGKLFPGKSWKSKHQRKMGSNLFWDKRKRCPMDARSLHLKVCHHKGPHTTRASTAMYLGNLSLRTLMSPMKDWEETNHALRGVLWWLHVWHWRR